MTHTDTDSTHTDIIDTTPISTSSTNEIKAHTPRAYKSRRKRSLKPTQARFLKALPLEYGQIAAAARRAGVKPISHYAWMRDSQAYREAYQRARQTILEQMEREVDRRAFQGVKEPIVGGSRIIGHKRVYSDRLAELRLKAMAPDRYAERSEVRQQTTGAVLHMAAPDLTSLPAEERRREMAVLVQRLQAVGLLPAEAGAGGDDDAE